MSLVSAPLHARHLILRKSKTPHRAAAQSPLQVRPFTIRRPSIEPDYLYAPGLAPHTALHVPVEPEEGGALRQEQKKCCSVCRSFHLLVYAGSKTLCRATSHPPRQVHPLITRRDRPSNPIPHVPVRSCSCSSLSYRALSSSQCASGPPAASISRSVSRIPSTICWSRRIAVSTHPALALAAAP